MLIFLLILYSAIIPLVALGIFIFSIVRLRKFKKTHLKVLAAVTGAYLLIVISFFAWRIGDITLSPKVVYNDDKAIIFEGHHYIGANFDADEFPYGNMRKVALLEYPSDSRVTDFINNVFFPINLYVENDDLDKDALWEKGLMLERKYTRVD